MAIQTLKNQYAGINPHLNSLLQTPGNVVESWASLWPTFHSSYLGDLTNALNDELPSIYVARLEHSIQVRADYLGGLPRMHVPEPDVTIFGERSRTANLTGGVTAPEMGILEKTLDIDEDFIKAVVVYQASDDSLLGKIIARMELISPSNTPYNAGYRAYRDNRNEALFSGIPLVELHYLHELQPPLMEIPDYPLALPSHAYHIFVSDPRPSVKEGHFYDYWFDVGNPFPRVNIPLAGTDQLHFDFGIVYENTFRRGHWGTWQNLVDYTQLPERFDTYSPADQERIRLRMNAIAEAQARGDDLEA